MGETFTYYDEPTGRRVTTDGDNLLAVDGVPIQPDDKGRPDVRAMSDRELSEEIVLTMRATQDLVTDFIANFSKNPMFGMMSKMLGGR